MHLLDETKYKYFMIFPNEIIHAWLECDPDVYGIYKTVTAFECKNHIAYMHTQPLWKFDAHLPDCFDQEAYYIPRKENGLFKGPHNAFGRANDNVYGPIYLRLKQEE